MSAGEALICWLLLTGVGSLVAWKDIARRQVVGLAVANAVGSFIAYNLALPSSMNIRVDLFLTVPLVLGIVGLGMRYWSRRPPPGSNKRNGGTEGDREK